MCLVGGHDLLGNWTPSRGIEMDWVKGTHWKVTVALPAHSLIQYKYVIRSGWSDDGPAQWQGGPDHLIATGAAHSSQEIRDVWIDNSWPDDNPNVAAILAAVTAHSKIKSPRSGSTPTRRTPRTSPSGRMTPSSTRFSRWGTSARPR